MDDRKRQVLQAIIDDYISTAEPIGSRTIARKYNLGVSPATIRNEMSDLEVLGYLEQPHTSAGRIPSGKGYRFYVDCLMSPTTISENDIAMISQWYNSRVRKMDEVFQETARMISRMTHNVSVVIAPQPGACRFKYLQFMPFDDSHVVVVIVTDTGIIENKMIEIPPDTPFEDLSRIAQIINTHLQGRSIGEIKEPLLNSIKQDILPRPELLEGAISLLKQISDTDKNEKFYLGGTTQLLNQPEFRDVEKVRNLLGMLEEESLICDILHRQDNEGVVVTIGQENKFAGIKDFSVIQASFRLDGQLIGTMAVLGPTRMEYGRTMAVVDFMHRHLGDMLKKYPK